MTTQLHCECNSEWIVGLIQTPLQFQVIPDSYRKHWCVCVCGFHPWYDAYDENEARDLKWMNN